MWSDVTGFELSEAVASPVKPAPVKLMRIQHNEGAAECPYSVSVLLDGKKHGAEEEASFPSTPHLTKFSTPPTILRKKKRLRAGQSAGSELNEGVGGDAISLALKHTPVKTLPFSPSQVSSREGCRGWLLPGRCFLPWSHGALRTAKAGA